MFNYTINLGQLTDWIQIFVSIVGFVFIYKALKLQRLEFQHENEKHLLSIRPQITIEYAYVWESSPREMNFKLINSGEKAVPVIFLCESIYEVWPKKLSVWNANDAIELKLTSAENIGNKVLSLVIRYTNQEGNDYVQEFKGKSGSTIISRPTLLYKAAKRTD